MDAKILLEGFGMGAGLIMAIGAQNAFVLKKGIKRENILLIAALCSVIDVLLIICGVIGFGEIINRNKYLLAGATLLGIIFLTIYSIKSFKSVFNPEIYKESNDNSGSISVKRVVLTILALSLLNPHVYLDTVILLGSIGARYPIGDRYSFALGASLSSITWFFSLSFGAGLLSPLFKKKLTWQILDFVIGVVMVYIIVQLFIFMAGII